METREMVTHTYQMRIGDVVHVSGHGRATVTGVNRRGVFNSAEVQYQDGSKHQLRGDVPRIASGAPVITIAVTLCSGKLAWADVAGDEDGDAC